MNRFTRLFFLAALRRHALLLATLLIAPLLALTEGNYTYSVSNGKATITGFSSSYSGALAIPSTLGGYPVVALDDMAFYDCSSLRSVTIPEGVTSIGLYTFNGCSSLRSVTIPASTISLDGYAFYQCSSLAIIVEPGNPSYASQDGCLFTKGYTALLAAPGVKGNYEIPSSVTSIGDYAFAECSSLTSVTIPPSVTSIGGDAFRRCDSLTSVTLPSRLTSVGDAAFVYCSSLTSVTIPEGVTSIGSRMFRSCSSLTSVEIPSSVTSIGAGAFADCRSLVITVNPANPSYVSQDGYLFTKGYTTLLAAPSLTGDYVIPSSVTSIGDMAFYGCRALTSVTIPEGVTTIGYGAFGFCTSLTSMTIPESVTAIGNEAFYFCSSLTSMTIPSRVTTIGWYTFEYCKSLRSVTFPEGLASVGSAAFRYCSSLISVSFLGKPCVVSGSTFPKGVQGYYPTKYSEAWEAVIGSNGTWNGLVMECVREEEGPTVEGDEGATIEGSAEDGWVVKPSEGAKEVVVSVPEGVEVAKVTVEVPSTVTSVTANGATIKVIKIEGDRRHDITEFLLLPAAVEGKIDLSQAEVKSEFAEAILDTSAEGGAVFDPAADQPLTTAATKIGLTYTLLEGDSLDSLTEGESKVGDGNPWQPQVTQRGASAFYRIRISK